ncbi:MAG: OmpA family protein [Gammaproteobacteria bacterium]|nr:OmpA family protein [Gammaproteobacteria bacterium]
MLNRTDNRITRVARTVGSLTAGVRAPVRLFKSLIAMLLLTGVHAVGAAPPGTLIDNTAQASFDVGVAIGLSENSNMVTVTTTILRTPSVLSLLSYQPSSSTINEEAPTQCRNGAGGPFIPSANPSIPVVGSGITVLDPGSALPLNTVNIYNSGEPIFVQLEDNDQNINSLVADTATVIVSSSLGDNEEILLTETDINSGVFVAYIQSSTNAVTPYDCVLSVAPDATVQADYTDPADGTDNSASTSLVDPFGMVFSSGNGDPIDGISVQLINATTGLPAQPGVEIFGNDGISSFPNTLVTGSSATDSGGTVYNFPVGGYRFPLVLPGNYRLEIINATGYSVPSNVVITDLQLLPGSPFALTIDASYGQDFVVPAGPPIHVDIPIDPVATELVISKTSLSNDAAIGDFVRYQVTVENTEALASSVGVVVTDVLPIGFRYQSGSARLNGVLVADPVIAANGRTLEFAMGDIAPGAIANLTYVTEITSGTPLGNAINSAGAIDTLGSRSNTAQAVIKIRDELMRERNTIVGRVINGNCALEKPEEGRTSLRMQSVRKGDQINYELKFGVDDVQLTDYRIEINLPKGLQYIPSSSLLDDYAWHEPKADNQVLVYQFDPRYFQDVTRWQHSLRFRAKVNQAVFGRQVTTAHAQMMTYQGIEHSTPVANNVLLRQQPTYEERQFVFRPIFPTMEASLEEQDREQLDKIIQVMRDIDVVKVSIEGHADRRQISGQDAPYANNLELSRARAIAIAPYFQSQLKLSDEQVTVSAAGDTQPFASSASESGLALNRRVDIAVNAKVRTGARVDEVIVKDSGVLTSTIVPQVERKGAVVGTELDGVAGVRIYLEDGTYVITDENGKYHIEGVRPGTHVVQLDLSSLPAGMRVVECEQNSRFAGNSYSQFIDLQPGTLWRADFHVEEEPPMVSPATLQMHTQIDNGLLRYRIDNKGGVLPVNNYRLTVVLPDGVQYQTGSSEVHNKRISDPQISENILIFRFGDLSPNWDVPLTFTATVDKKIQGKLISKAAVIFDSETGKNQRIAPVETIALLDGRKFTPRRYVLNPHFDTLGAELSVDDKHQLDAMLPELLKSEIKRITVIGHTDNVPISARSRNIYQDNDALSKARAAAVANYLGTSLGLANQNVIAEGRGAGEPVTSNETAEGRAKNRRTEILIETVEAEGAEVSTMLRSSSDKASVDVIGERSNSEQVTAYQPPPTTRLTIDQFDEQWLERASPGIEWLMPIPEFTPEVRAVSVAIKHGPQDRIEGFINGEPLNPLFYFGAKQNKRGTVARSYWQGIHIVDGTNKLEFRVYPANGGKPVVLERLVHFSDAPVKAELVKEYSRLIADGRTSPVLAVRFVDHFGQLVRGGVTGEFSVAPPYESKQWLESMSKDKLAAYDREQPLFEISERGIAYIELEPTTQSGKAVLRFKLANGIEQQLEAWLKPAQRDWIVVGMGEAVIGDHDVAGDSNVALQHDLEADSYSNNRLALFAKGNIGEDWLLTTAIDSDKEDAATGHGLFQTIDPDEYFALYGDDTDQRYEASSQDKLFLRLENERFYSLYGDFDTGLNNTELSKYSRRLTGLKSEFDSDRFGLNLFAADTDNHYVRDEIQGDGTSGLYRLRGNDIIINSETIVVETRDRFHSQDILEQRTLRRHYDYNIDYLGGTIFFKRPIPSRDLNFNPVFIVAEYETQTGIADELTAGARGEIRLAGGDIKLGVSAINDGTLADESELYGLDAEFKFGVNSTLRLEMAGSETNNAGILVEGDAYLAEYELNYESIDGRIYIREQDAGFGLGQQADSEMATRKYGLEGSYKLTERIRLNSEVFHEDNLATNAERDIAELDASYTTGQNTFMAGMRSAHDVMGDGQENDSELLLAGASTKLLDNKLLLRANAEFATGSNDANPAYPTRYIVGSEYTFSPSMLAYLEQEITEGTRQDTNSTRFGIRATPWSQANIDTSIEQQTSEYGPRTFALMGLTQGFRMNERWSGDLSYDRAETIRDPGDTPFNVNVPPQSGTYNNDYDAISTGLTRRGDSSTAVLRLEQRNSDQEDRHGMLLGWHRDLLEGISYGIDSQWFASEYADGSETTSGNLRLSFAYRPVTSNWIHLNRFDYKFDERVDNTGNEEQQRKLINNWKANYLPNRRNQIAFSYGVKYVLDTYDETEYKGLTHSLGSEYRYDVTQRWDIGAHADVLYSANANNKLYSYGLSTGYNLIKNLWLSVGYNFAGFKDDDFTSAEYTADGPYLKLRFKFDQGSFGVGQH